MHHHDRFSDETPIADAVEQGQEPTLEPAVPDVDVPLVEADAFDWREQHQEIVGTDDDREEYRE